MPQARRVRRVIRKIDVWSVLRFSVVFYACVFAVLIVELLNTGIEVVVDRIGAERHILSGRAKDLGSAAVHLSLLQVPLTWALVLFG